MPADLDVRVYREPLLRSRGRPGHRGNGDGRLRRPPGMALHRRGPPGREAARDWKRARATGRERIGGTRVSEDRSGGLTKAQSSAVDLSARRRRGGRSMSRAHDRSDPGALQMQSIAPVRLIDPGARPPPSTERSPAERAPRSSDARPMRSARTAFLRDQFSQRARDRQARRSPRAPQSEPRRACAATRESRRAPRA